MSGAFGGVFKHELPPSGKRDPEVTSCVMTIMRWAMVVTFAACVLLTTRYYCVDNISCITGTHKRAEHHAIENYCFVSGTFTILNLDTDETPHPGVGPHQRSNTCGVGNEDCESDDNMRRHAYYQWVPFVLLLQAAIYHLPKFIWKLRDRDYFKDSICGLNYVMPDKNWQKHSLKSSAEYFHENFNTHWIYAVSFLFCEMIAFSIAVGNLYFTNTFLGGHFFEYGHRAIHYLTQPASNPDNPLNEVFPKVTKCSWHKIGPSGTVNTQDIMCVLPNNIFNEKTYLLLWILYIAIATIVGIVLLWHIILFLLPSVRNTLLVWMTRHSDTNVNLQLQMNLQHILPKCNYGDWFLIYHYRRELAYFPEWLQHVRDLNI